MVPNLTRKIFAILLFSALAVFSFFNYRIKLGLDLQGGSRIVYRLDFEKALASGQISASEDRYAVLQETAEVFIRRVDILGVQDITIYPQGDDQIVVELPGRDHAFTEQIKRTIINQGSLRFRIIASDQDDLSLQAEIEKLRTWRQAHPGEPASAFNRAPEAEGGPRAGLQWFDIDPKVLESDPEAAAILRAAADLDAVPVRAEDVLRGPPSNPDDSWDFTGADLGFVGPSVDPTTGYPVVQFEMVEHRKAAFADFTGTYKGRQMAIILNDKVHSAPEIQDRLMGTSIISGGRKGFTYDEVRELVTVLRTGSLKIQPELESQTYVGPSLGEDAIRTGMWSCLAGGALVFAFMIGYYWLNGVVACISMLFNGFLLLGALSFTQATLTLPGIAGLVLTIGMAVDANILIFERVREERRKGREVAQAYKNGFERAFVTIVDSNLTTLISGIILYLVGTGPVRGFAVTLSLGIISTLFAVLVFSKVLFHWLVFSRKPVITEVRMAQFLGKEPKVPWVKYRRVAYAASSVLVLGGLGVFFANYRDLLGIDFVGGVSARLRLSEPVAIGTMRDRLPGYTVLSLPSEQPAPGGEHSDTFLVKRKLDPELERVLEEGGTSEAGKVAQVELAERLSAGDGFPGLAAQDPFPELSIVGGRVSGSMQQKAVQALILALIAMVIYMNFRFKEMRYGIAGVIAVFHDMLFALGAVSVYSVLRFGTAEINLETVAAFLTIIGYSLNDTIVIFDRIRENLPRRKGTFAELIDLSINQTLSRTIFTATTVFLTVAVLFVANRQHHNALEGFSLAMLVGTVVGTYSTVFIAAPMLLFLDRWSRHKKVEPAAGETR
ncbi:MAG: protein translocase subunit SecD [Planctomycetota bacterium]|nr:MAG: protein translocase subunit SecD [Planctomycetota bacterium]